jgi:hypothetical protein
MEVYGFITLGILGVLIIFLFFKGVVSPLVSVLKSAMVQDGVTVNPNDFKTGGKFDPDKFNVFYTEVKKKRQEAAKKRSQERLARLQELNKEVNKVNILDIKVYDLIVGYGNNVYTITSDIINGQPWYDKDRLIYFGWTLIMVSLVYFLLNNI